PSLPSGEGATHYRGLPALLPRKDATSVPRWTARATRCPLSLWEANTDSLQEQPYQYEQIFQNLRQEYSRIQRRRQLEGAFNQTEACSSSDTPSPSSSLNAPSSPPGASRKDQPSFTLRQVSCLCERLLKDHEEKIREEYEQILNTKLAEQYESFVKFTQDQIMRRYGARPASYVS
ncbi:Akirin-1, partial [Goodea atripinnis]